MTQDFGTLKNGEKTRLYTLENKRGLSIALSDYGACLVKAVLPDKRGKRLDVTLGYESAADYERADKFFGATVGRIANRIGNAAFSLNGREYRLTANEGAHNLHSGPDCYNKRIWKTKEAGEGRVVFALRSPDGDQGYPGEIDIEVSYTLTEENEIKIHYRALPKADTFINLTNHSYFNLEGHDSGDALSQELWIDADAYTRTDKDSIPTGEIVDVTGTPMDFRRKKPIGRDIEARYEALLLAGGYDHNFVLNGEGLRKAAKLSAPKSGITLEVYTDLLGMQFYAGNFLAREEGKGGAVYGKRQGVCFETQYFPDAMNHENFKSPLVRAGEVYETETVFKFV